MLAQHPPISTSRRLKMDCWGSQEANTGPFRKHHKRPLWGHAQASPQGIELTIYAGPLIGKHRWPKLLQGILPGQGAGNDRPGGETTRISSSDDLQPTSLLLLVAMPPLLLIYIYIYLLVPYNLQPKLGQRFLPAGYAAW